MEVILAGAGAFGTKHLDGIKKIDGVSVIGLVGRRLEPTRKVAGQYGIEHVFTDLTEALKLQEVEAVILCTPTQLHARQAIQCMDAAIHSSRRMKVGVHALFRRSRVTRSLPGI